MVAAADCLKVVDRLGDDAWRLLGVIESDTSLPDNSLGQRVASERLRMQFKNLGRLG